MNSSEAPSFASSASAWLAEHRRAEASTVTDAIESGDLLVVVGERDHHGTIWVNSNPLGAGRD